MSLEELPEYQNQLAQVEELLQQDPTNEELITMKATLVDLIATLAQINEVATAQEPAVDEPSTVSLSGEAKTAIGEGEPGAQPTPTTASALTITRLWRVGDRVMSRWPEDNQIYLAKIERIISPDGDLVTEVPTDVAAKEGYTFNVLYLQYANTDTVKSSDLAPFEPPPRAQLLPGQVVSAFWPEDGLFYEAVIEGISHVQKDAAAHSTEPGHEISAEKTSTAPAKVQMYRVKFRHNRARSERSQADLYIPPEWQGKRVAVGGLAALTAAALSDDLDAELPGFVLPDKLKILPSDSESERKLKQLRARQLKKAYVLQSKELTSARKAQRWSDFQTKLRTGKLVSPPTATVSTTASPAAATATAAPRLPTAPVSSAPGTVAAAFRTSASRHTDPKLSWGGHATVARRGPAGPGPVSTGTSDSRRQMLHSFQRAQAEGHAQAQAQAQAYATAQAQGSSMTYQKTSTATSRSVFGDDDDDD